jgi:ankyrin repeat protein
MDSIGWTAFHHSCYIGCLKRVCYLVNVEGVHTEAIDARGHTALHLATMRGFLTLSPQSLSGAACLNGYKLDAL